MCRKGTSKIDNDARTLSGSVGAAQYETMAVSHRVCVQTTDSPSTIAMSTQFQQCAATNEAVLENVKYDFRPV